ncbi:hypothetical protein Nepgr_011102 [Nepenthes gracilis]|uniref:Uncharacterized protein n=1 Tax=Nepenthes gracilis TaxID=150966 RepID=A0AAD3SEG2_NEPGR|nr:hypothetical protein Nepgr_011102 [Nepenthes gracilis]
MSTAVSTTAQIPSSVVELSQSLHKIEHNHNWRTLRCRADWPVAELEGEPVAELDGEPVVELGGCLADWPVVELEEEPVVELDGCRTDWSVAELDGCRTDWSVAELDGESVAALNYNSQSVQAAMWQLASLDLIESYNKAEVEHYCVTKDLRSGSSPVKSMLDSWGQTCLCGKNRQWYDDCCLYYFYSLIVVATERNLNIQYITNVCMDENTVPSDLCPQSQTHALTLLQELDNITAWLYTDHGYLYLQKPLLES